VPPPSSSPPSSPPPEAGSTDVDISPIRDDEIEPLFALFERIVADLDGWPQAPPLTREVFENTWIHPVTVVVAARVDGELAGAYLLKANHPGRAAHIANAGYAVDRRFRGRGVGRALVVDSITRAADAGFDAIQFNLVFESNPARALYEELGWVEIGRLPRAVDGEDAILYWREV
jgi:ribosomal protein S18 acetylase RimI-like enzyme